MIPEAITIGIQLVSTGWLFGIISSLLFFLLIALLGFLASKLALKRRAIYLFLMAVGLFLGYFLYGSWSFVSSQTEPSVVMGFDINLSFALILFLLTSIGLTYQDYTKRWPMERFVFYLSISGFVIFVVAVFSVVIMFEFTDSELVEDIRSSIQIYAQYMPVNSLEDPNSSLGAEKISSLLEQFRRYIPVIKIVFPFALAIFCLTHALIFSMMIRSLWRRVRGLVYQKSEFTQFHLPQWSIVALIIPLFSLLLIENFSSWNVDIGLIFVNIFLFATLFYVFQGLSYLIYTIISRKMEGASSIAALLLFVFFGVMLLVPVYLLLLIIGIYDFYADKRKLDLPVS